ncbi:MAG TPA: DUF3108 domain-containing protein [Burkholderiales bacterium]|nr:DUF3108 domain-containing protein [Burkholderiales bacterium]
MRNSFWLLTSLSVALSALAQTPPPARVELEYDLLRNGKIMAEVVERLDHGNGSYELTETWRGKGMYALLGRAKRKSEGTLGADGPRPREYVDERSGRDTQRVSFDWSANTITRRYKGATRTEPVPADTQDRLSFLLALTYFSQKDQPISFHVADGRGMSRHTYKPNGRERLGTPAGEFDTVKLIRANHGSGEVAEIWLAANRSYLPVRIVVVEKDGTRYEHVATRISPP